MCERANKRPSKKRGKTSQRKQNRNSIIVLDFSLFGILFGFSFHFVAFLIFLRQNEPNISTKSSLNSIESGVHHSLGVWRQQQQQWWWNLESAQTIKVEYFIFGWIFILLRVGSRLRWGVGEVNREREGSDDSAMCWSCFSSVHKYAGVSSFCRKTA